MAALHRKRTVAQEVQEAWIALPWYRQWYYFLRVVVVVLKRRVRRNQPASARAHTSR
jgi:hypothetical protein